MLLYPVITPDVLDVAAQLQHVHVSAYPGPERAGEIAEHVFTAVGSDDADAIVQYLKGGALGRGLGSPENGAWFWSHSTTHPVTGERVGNRYVGMAAAVAHERHHPDNPMAVLEATPGGKWLDEHGLANPQVREALGITHPHVTDIWGTVSTAYGQQASGRAYVMAPSKHPWTMLEHEMRALRRNQKVPTAVFTTFDGHRTRYHHEQLGETGAAWNVQGVRPHMLTGVRPGSMPVRRTPRQL
jgi:hypothetical protein